MRCGVKGVRCEVHTVHVDGVGDAFVMPPDARGVANEE